MFDENEVTQKTEIEESKVSVNNYLLVIYDNRYHKQMIVMR